jgi:twitching motility protein PilT
LTGKELLNAFRSAPLKSEEEADAFLESADEVEPGDVLRLLDLLLVRGASDSLLHRRRCSLFARLAERAADKSLFAPFVRGLKTADADLRAALAELIPKVNSVTEHPALCALLRSTDPMLRAVVARTLKAIGGKTVFDQLEEMVDEPDFAGRHEAMDVLLAVGEHRAIPALLIAFAAGSPPEKVVAIDCLCDPRCANRDRPAVLKALAAAVQEPHEWVAIRGIGGLSRLADEEDYFRYAMPALEAASLNVTRSVLEGLRSFASSRSIAALQRKLVEGPNQIRLVALETLEEIGTAAVLKPLVDALSHGHVTVRMRAAEALSHLSQAGKIELARTVVWLLRSRDVNIRRMAVELAQTVRDEQGELWPKLLACLRDEDWWVRERVMDALLEIASDKLLRPIVPYLEDDSDVVRRFAVDVLMRLKAPESLGALVRVARQDADWWVRERAVAAIAAINDPQAVPYVVDLMLHHTELQVACLDALGTMAAKETGSQVASLLGSSDDDVRLAALDCLRAINDHSQFEAVRAAASDANHQVRETAQDLLARWQASALPETIGTTEVATSLLDQLLVTMARAECDDLILTPGRRPYVKRFGKVFPLVKTVLTARDLRGLLMRYLSLKQMRDLEALRDVDFSYEVPSQGLRFRVNVFEQQGGTGAVFRIVKGDRPELQALGLPPVVETLGDLKNGLVLVGGPTGSGKSTTLAALVDYINRTSSRHIITFEDPIEVVHRRAKSLVNQREIGTHTGAFEKALRATLREDPNVILIGEMRDFPTISFAVTAAETGHLVFGTLHTFSAALSVDRMVNAFPPGQQDQVRSSLAGSLRAVVCQFLHTRRDAPGRCLSVEVMLNNEAIANLIRRGRVFQIPSVIATSREQGMQLMDAELMRLNREGKISAEDAYMRAMNKKDFEPLLDLETS